MKGDFSRLTGLKAKRKHYNGVLKQQGRVQIDSDWNELISILDHQRKARTLDTIGFCGAPVHHSGFQILHPGNGMADLLIATGRFYAGGLLGETTPASKLPLTGFSGNNKVLAEDLHIDGIQLNAGHWVQISTRENPDGIIAKITQLTAGQITVDQNLSTLHADHDPALRLLILFSEQPDLPNGPGYAPVNGQTDLLYLDVWERHITPIEDPELREVALGGPDTDTRSRTIAQIKVLANVGDNLHCEDEIEPWKALIKPPNGRLTTRLVTPPPPDSPCELGESGGYLGLENHLYRVEVHQDSRNGSPTFKWSRDNAAFAYAIKEFLPDPGGAVFRINLQQHGKDEILKIKQQDWVEISGEHTDLDTESHGTLARVVDVVGTTLYLDTDVQAHKDEPLAKVRRWEISNHRPNVTTPITAGTGFQLEDGIEIEFSGSEFHTGDYWVFSARMLTGEIELLEKEPPLGVKHHYCKLALVTGIAGGNVSIEDCRPEFPPLTEIDDGGCCTVTVGRNEDYREIQPAIDSLNGGPGTVCIKPGVYLIDKPLQVKGHDITIKGCEGTPIIVNTSKGDGGTVFYVEDSRNIRIHDLWAIAMEAARVVQVENTLLFRLFNCMLVGGGTSDLGGVVTCLGLSIDARIEDNLLMGMIGIRLDGAEGQKLNLHMNTRVERNILFVLETGLLKRAAVLQWGLDVIDNMMLGISLDLIGKAFFPQNLATYAEKNKLHDAKTIADARKGKKKDVSFAALKDRNEAPAYALHSSLKTKAAVVKVDASGMVAVDLPSAKPLLDLHGMVADGTISDNLLIGKAGMYVFSSIEMVVNSNIILAQSQGAEFGTLEGLTLRDNSIKAGLAALQFTGQVVLNLEVENNRLVSDTNGVEFLEGKEDNIQAVANAYFGNNWIVAKQTGISLNNLGIVLMDFTVVDNSIRGCETWGILINVLDENQFQEVDEIALQRVIQRNLISVSGGGLILNVSDCKVLENDITIDSPAGRINFSRGIVLMATNGVLEGNTIQARVNAAQKRDSYGGIYIYADNPLASTRLHRIEVRNNQIIGGKQHGIEIGSDLKGLVIEHNQIAGMGLCGITAQEQVLKVEELYIRDNHIRDCLQSAGATEQWWTYGGIVLPNVINAQISGNIIRDNGLQMPQGSAHSAIFLEYAQQLALTGNQLLNNGPQGEGEPNGQAAIHIPTIRSTELYSTDIQICRNQVKSGNGPSLILGDVWVIHLSQFTLYFPTSSRTQIAGNQFDSTMPGPVVRVESSQCQFSDNHVNCGPADSSVFLGHGWQIVATSNLLSDPFLFLGSVWIDSNNLIY
jgi:hypothetical protein